MTTFATSTGRGGGTAPVPVWTVGTVARRLGVAPSTLRTWGLRYGIGPEGHLPGQHRRYSADDVAELATIRRLVEQGVVLAAAAAIAHGERYSAPLSPTASADVAHGPGTAHGSPSGVGTGIAPSTAPVSTQELARLVDAARRLDSTEATTLVATALARHGVVSTWDTLCRPALTALSDAGPDPTAQAVPDGNTDGCVDAELLLQWAVSTSLRRLPGAPATAADRPVLLACADTEQHTLAMEALHAALIERHVDVRMLGPAVPDTALLTATKALQPTAAVIWAQTTVTADRALLHTLTAWAARVVAAGPGWNPITLRPPIARASSLQDALTLTAEEQPLASG